jgi:hypothetical protein
MKGHKMNHKTRIVSLILFFATTNIVSAAMDIENALHPNTTTANRTESDIPNKMVTDWNKTTCAFDETIDDIGAIQNALRAMWTAIDAKEARDGTQSNPHDVWKMMNKLESELISLATRCLKATRIAQVRNSPLQGVAGGIEKLVMMYKNGQIEDTYNRNATFDPRPTSVDTADLVRLVHETLTAR